MRGPSTPDRLEGALAAIDAVNAEDPNRLTVRGRSQPKALAEGQLATNWVRRLAPKPNDALLIAARAHHLRRWEMPRATYPDGRAGYLRWRRDQHERQATAVGELLAAAGYDEGTIARVQDIVRKKDLRHDAEVQDFEDALCLVFLETQFGELADRVADDDKMVDVVRKTIAKMSPRARAEALRMEFTADERRLLSRALDG